MTSERPRSRPLRGVANTAVFLRAVDSTLRAIAGCAGGASAPSGVDGIETAYAGMKQAIEQGGDYVKNDLAFHQGLLRACHNRMVVQMSKALGALLRTSFELSTAKPDGPAKSLPLHRAVLDAVIARNPAKAEKAILVLIDGA
ncbi:MAG TPA: FCD domain-containing protein, partial [Thauera aminoaromatica]|nr:FCD domain-containing protein [Thauera aminoaromatica]